MKQIDVYDEILEWSKTRPLWQRDALRRIVTAGALSEADVLDLGYLCCLPHDAVDRDIDTMAAGAPQNSGEVEPVPLDISHFRSKSATGTSVSLIALKKLTNVNRLSPTNEIEFGQTPGLSIVYGNNGSGKSGYARVIRRACRARGATPPIEPNVFKIGPPSPAKAEFVLSVNGGPATATWTDGQPTGEHLGRILFFDGICADHYIQEDAGASFIPDGLDVLTKLTQACDIVRDRLGTRIRSTVEQIDSTKRNWTLHDGTRVATFLANMTAVSDESRVETLAQWDNDVARRLDEIRLLLASNPETKAAATRASADRVADFARKIDDQVTALDYSKVSALRASRNELAEAEAAHALASQSQFSDGYLPGTGSEAWSLLWEAARRYSTLEAYPDSSFPNTSNGALCVLCQTPLDPAASIRLKAFERYVNNEILKILEEIRSRLSEQIEAVELVPNLDTAFLSVQSDLAELPEPDRSRISAFVTEAWARRNSILAFAETGSEPSITTSFAGPAQTLHDLETQKRAQANSEAALHDSEARRILQKEGNELEDRLWLSSHRDLVLEQIGRLKDLARLNEAQADTSTAKVTAKATTLNTAIVTKALCTAFETEIQALGLQTIAVELRSAGGQKGTLRFGVRLTGLDTKVVGRVASEGEKRCIAFALFLAELSQTSDTSALVLDDPVSSLDHLHCGQMAKRIAREATNRQVIVFTHHPLFLHELQTQAEKLGSRIHLGYLQWDGETPGQWVPGLPWEWKSVQDRFNQLHQMQQKLAKTTNTQMSEDEKAGVRRAYTLLRGSLERVVETKIFGGAVMRFSNYVNLKFVEKAVGFSQAEFDKLKDLYDRCSDISEAHDHSSGSHLTVPTPAQLKLDIEATEALVAEITARQNKAKKSGMP